MSSKKKVSGEHLDVIGMSEEILRIDLKAYQSAGMLLKAAEDLLLVVEDSARGVPRFSCETLTLIRAAQKELRQCTKRRKDLATNRL